MKRWKKLAAMLLAMAMAVSMLCVGAFAADDEEGEDSLPQPTYTITIRNTASGHTYGAYQIFSGRLTKDAASPVLANIKWGDGVRDTNALLKALQEDPTLGESFKDAKEAEDVARILSTFSNSQKEVEIFAKIVAGYLTTEPKGTSVPKDEGYEIKDIPVGYYLVKDMDEKGIDYATKYILNLVNNISVDPKGDSPKVIKKVKENTKTVASNKDNNMPSYTIPEGYNDVADYSIGDKVPFLLVGSMPSNIADYETYTYIFHDTMDKGLTFNADSVIVIVDNTEIPATTADGHKNYEVIVKPTDEHTFDVKFSNVKNLVDESGKTISITDKTKIEVQYNATLNSNANVGLPGNVNTVYLEYSNNPNGDGTGETPKDKVIVFTYKLDVTKTSDKSMELPNAEFILYKEVGDEKLYYAQTDPDNKIYTWTDQEEQATRFRSGNNGMFSIIGLDDGTYYLQETAAPDGYSILEKPIQFTISADTVHIQTWSGTANEALEGINLTLNAPNMDLVKTTGKGNIESGNVNLIVINKSGSTLPSTGGIGTTIFYVVGGLLMAGAAVLLIVKKRMSK